LDVAACGWIVVAHPVLMQARIRLEPLAGEARKASWTMRD